MDKVLTKKMYDDYMKGNNRRLDEIERVLESKSRAKWIKKLTYEQWVQFQSGELKIHDPLNSKDIRWGREFNHVFKPGTEVMLDESVLDMDEKEYYKNEIGVKGIVIRHYSDLHAFGQGSSYGHEVQFENGVIRGDEIEIGESHYGGYNLTPVLIPFKGE